MVEVFNHNGFPAGLVKQKGTPTILRCEAAQQGKIAKDVAFQICFLPLSLPHRGSELLQFSATLLTDVPHEHETQLYQACVYCNQFSVLGTFGLLERTRELYLQHNTLLDEALSLAQSISFIANHFSVLLASVGSYIDGFTAIAYSGTPLEKVVAQKLFPDYPKEDE